MAKEPTAYWPTPSLLRSLSRAGWGDLTGRENHGVRSALKGLVDLLDDRSGAGLATAYQLAETTGYSERWIRACLMQLEELGIIEWSRGGIRQGKPQPSFFKIIKGKLVALIKKARATVEERRREHARETTERLRKVNQFTYISAPRKARKKVHAEVTASPRPPYGGALKGAHPVEEDLLKIYERVRKNHERIKEKARAETRALTIAQDRAIAEFTARTGLQGSEAYRALLKERWTRKEV